MANRGFAGGNHTKAKDLKHTKGAISYDNVTAPSAVPGQSNAQLRCDLLDGVGPQRSLAKRSRKLPLMKLTRYPDVDQEAPRAS